MANEIEEAQQLDDCGCDNSPAEYEGVFGCQLEEQAMHFRTKFRNKQYRTPKVTWDEIKAQFSSFRPTIMCDPCATPEAMSFSDGFFRREVTPIHMASLMTIDCGEIEQYRNEPQMGVDCNVIRDEDQIFRDLLMKRGMMQNTGFIENEDCLALEFMMTQGINLPKSDYLPNGGELRFERDEELNCVTQECFGKGQCNTKGILRRWANKVECVDGFDQFRDVYMHCDTWEEFLMGDDMQDCLKGFDPRLTIEDQLINQMTKQPLTRQKGVSLVWRSPEGIRFWKVNMKKRYCTETGDIVKYDMMPKNELHGFNFGTGPCSYSPVWGYVPVLDLAKSATGSIKTLVNATSRAVKTKVVWHPGAVKQIMQSNMMPFLPYKNSSSVLKLCVDPKSETFKLKTDIVPADAREANEIQAAVKAVAAAETSATAAKALKEIKSKEADIEEKAKAQVKGGK